MDILLSIYNEVLWRPLFNGFVFLYNIPFFRDAGLAIILLTLVVRAILVPLMWKAQKSQKELASLQPEIKKIQEEYKSNKEAQSKALMELYSQKKINPFSGCLVMLIQLPILIALFHVFQQVFDAENFKFLYSFVRDTATINTISFGILDLAKPNIYLGAAAALAQYFQTRLTGTISPLTSDKKDFSQMLQWQMTYIFPLLILVWSYTFQSSLILYWTALNIFSIIQELIVKRIKVSKINSHEHGINQK